MITGEWGSGKTWLVNEIMNQEGLEHLRISLFGISSRQEVYDEFFAQCHPMLASAGTRVVAGIARGILSRITFPIGSANAQSQTQFESLGLKELLINVREKIVIFDDFERCRLPVREMMGLISNLLEDDNCKVVIISNDSEIRDDDYTVYKEKVVAYTFKAEPELERALDDFWNVMAGHRLDDTLVNEIKEIIGNVHDQSGYKNLRHLKISLEAFETLYSTLPDSAKQNGELVKELLYINSIFSYEVLHGIVYGHQVIELFSKMMYGSRSDSQPSEGDRIGILASKYRPSMSRDLILDPDIWINLFAQGSLDKEAVQSSIERSRFFIGQRTPTWRKLLEVWSFSNDELRDLLAQLKEDIRCENFSNVGEILHVTGILLWLSNRSLYSEPPEEIVRASVCLLNSLRAQQKLVCRPSDRSLTDRDNVFANIFFLERANPAFEQVLERAKDIEKEIHQSNLETSASALMDILPNDVFGFTRQLVHAHLGDRHSLSGSYADEPILASVDPVMFVESLMSLRPMYRRDLLYGIAQRYKHPELARMLCSELQWLDRVNNDLKQKLADAGASLEAFQLQTALDEFITPSIVNLKAASVSADTPQENCVDGKA
jgi:hypothetical protein